MFNKDFKIYFIAGKARHGKSTLGNLIEEEYYSRLKKVIKIQYSHYIKDYAISFFGWDGKEETKPRELLNKIGDIIRNKLNKPTFFIDRLSEDVEILSYFFDVIIVDDMRLKIEIDSQRKYFDKNAIFIRVDRENFDNGLSEEEKNHFTECDLDNYHNFDYSVKNNGTLEHLKKIAEKIVNEQEER